MRSYTQISSGSQQTGALTELEQKLNQLDIHLTPSPPYKNPDTLWQTYSAELQFYKSIAKCSFHILYNDTELTNPMLMQTLYAAYKHRPVILIGRVKYHDDLDPKLRKIFEAQARKFHAANLLKLEFAELSFLLNKLKPEIDYRLSHEDEVAIVTKIREYLYDMVGQGLGEMNSPLSS